MARLVSVEDHRFSVDGWWLVWMVWMVAGIIKQSPISRATLYLRSRKKKHSVWYLLHDIIPVLGDQNVITTLKIGQDYEQGRGQAPK